MEPIGERTHRAAEVVITPHLGGRAFECDVNAVANAERIARGKEPLWVVNSV